MTSFYINHPKAQKSTISILVHAFGFRLRKSLGISVNPNQWDKRKQRLKMLNVENAMVNKFLEDLSAKSNNLIREFQVRRILPTPNMFTEELFNGDQIVSPKDDFWVSFENWIEFKKKTLQPISIKKFKTLYNILKKFKPNIHRLTDHILADFTNWLLAEKYSPNVIIKYAEILMAFSEWQGVTLKKKVKVQGMRSDRIYLNLEELEKIRAVKLPTQSLDNIRNIFLFMAWTGLRYSDVVKFDESFIQGQTLVFFSQKTGSKSVIPIFPIVGQILSKGLPRRPSGQKFNDILKEVCKYAGLTELIQLTKLEGERKIPYSLPKYEAVTAHTGRRSFVTNMSVMGLTAKQISLMTGHSQQRVVDIYDKTKAESNALSVVELLKGKV